MAGPGVIFVHGAFCGGWAFDRFREPFAGAGFRTLVPDLRGHAAGSARDATQGLSIADYAADIAALVAAEPAPPILVGHSMGGLVAQLAAARARVAALVLIAPSPPWGVAGSSLEEAVSAVSLYALGPFWTMAIEPDYSATAYSLDRFAEPERRALFARLTPESGRALWETLNWWLDPMMTTSVAAAQIGAPVLALAGEHDRIHPPATVAQTAERLGGETRVMAGMSHWLIAEPGWEAVAGAALDWLKAEALA